MRPTNSKFLALGATASALALLAGACASGGGSTSGSGGDQVHQMYTWVSTENDRAQWQSFVDAALLQRLLDQGQDAHGRR